MFLDILFVKSSSLLLMLFNLWKPGKLLIAWWQAEVFSEVKSLCPINASSTTEISSKEMLSVFSLEAKL